MGWYPDAKDFPKILTSNPVLDTLISQYCSRSFAYKDGNKMNESYLRLICYFKHLRIFSTYSQVLVQVKFCHLILGSEYMINPKSTDYSIFTCWNKIVTQIQLTFSEVL